MNAETAEPATVEATSAMVEYESDLMHIVCCDGDGKVALCGTDVTEEPWSTEPFSCAPCIEAEERHQCPLYGVCG